MDDDKDKDKDKAQKHQNKSGPQAGKIYRHYKGDLYFVVCRAIDEATLTPLVIYASQENGYVWSRTLANFTELVDGKPRFRREDQ